MDASRSINEIIFAMLFIAAVGLGPFAGVLALFVHTSGTLAKLFAEAVEAIDPQPVEGIRATGSNTMQDIGFGIIPQVMPLWVSYSLYRFEANVRSASIVGMVGAGGIGWCSGTPSAASTTRNRRDADRPDRGGERARLRLGARAQALHMTGGGRGCRLPDSGCGTDASRAQSVSSDRISD